MGSIYGETGKEREERCLVPRIPDDATYIDLDELEVTDSEEEPMRNRSNHRRFRLQDIYARPVLHSSRPQNNNSIGIRNPPIVAPLVLLSSFRFQDRKLWAGKTTVELGAGEYAGDFLRITHIIEDVSSGELVLRGQRFRRNRNVDHMLINKLNEVCLCLEIDVDDPRTSEEQSAVQVPLSDILTIRRLNLTNLKFPLGQDHHRVVSEQHISRKAKQKRVEAEGLLICRWKLSISYATAADRVRNKFMSNTLERLTASDITIDDRRVTESDTRIQWRGETVLGGSYRPAPQAEVTALSSTKTRSQKRTRSFSEQAVSEKTLEPVTPQISPRQLATPPHSSRPRVGNANSDSFRTPQRQLSNRSVQARTAEGLLTGFRGRGPLFGPASISARGSVSLIQKLTTHDSPSRRLVQDLARVPRGISSFASDLSTAPLSGVLRSSRSSACWTTRPRLPDQMFTYGDGFCGSGGATRGAWMAGLKVIWGFDFDELACASWRANFTNAECYQMAAHNFIDQANASETRRRAIEVDILHCSCPCQFYSSAHTRAGPNDEMNTASLFATHDLIKVVKPRIVTFEQTFGILAAAHRQYFCSLIHMLTELNFSVRWEVVQFQNWVRIESASYYVIGISPQY
jgi:DNA (cytosine-5)-methyltransferase 1